MAYIRVVCVRQYGPPYRHEYYVNTDNICTIDMEDGGYLLTMADGNKTAVLKEDDGYDAISRLIGR